MKTTTTESAKATAMLHTIETAIIDRMAKSTGYAAFQMKSMIKRCPELAAYYRDVRAQVIADMAA